MNENTESKVVVNQSYADMLSYLSGRLKENYRENLFEVCIKLSGQLSSMLYDLKMQQDADLDKGAEWG